MRRWKTAIVLIAMAAASTSVAVRAEPAVIQAQSAPAYNVSQALMQRGDGPLTAEDAALVERAVMADAQVDKSERAMLDALIAGEAYTIKPATTGSDISFNRIATQGAKDVLRKISSARFDNMLVQDWMSPEPEIFGKVIALYQANEEGRQQVLDMLGMRANAVAVEGWEDDYRELRSEIQLWAGKCGLLSDDDYQTCRSMIYEGILHGDRNGRDNTTGNIPDPLYQHWGPGQN